MITITGIPDHDETETAITFDWNLRSRSTGTRKDEALAVHVALTDPPALTLARHVRTVLLGCPQAFFLCVRPSRCSISATVERAFTSIPRSCSASRIFLSVIPGRLVAIDRRVSA